MEGFKKLLRKLPSKKPYIEVLTAVLTIPVLLTVIILNWNNLKGTREKKETPKPTESRVIVQSPTESQPTETTCKKEVGPISISSPKEDTTVSSNPVFINIRHSDSSYCSVVWSYRINEGEWSEYSSNNISLYNPPKGKIKFELRVQSTVSQDQEILERNFTYEGREIPTPTPTLNP